MGLAKRRETGLFEDPRQMLLPLLIDLDFNEKVLHGADPALVEDVRQDQPQLEEWTDDELVQMHQFLLEQSMIQALNPRSSKATRLEVLEWVDKVTPYKGKADALSFDACCQFSGYDPEELREQLHEEMKFRRIHPNHA